MSSLAAARADNFYYPPDYSHKHGSLNKFQKSHPLGHRARNIKEGILTIRFEMPFKVFCTGCNEVIAKGVRFNAEKKCVGMYFSTKILEFKMKCCFCPTIFRIQTNPKDCEYNVIEGLKKKTESFSFQDAQTIEFRSIEERHALECNPMLKLETQVEDKRKGENATEDLEDLIHLQNTLNSEGKDYNLNACLRQNLRTIKKQHSLQKNKKNFVLPLPALDSSHVLEASKNQYKNCKFEIQLAKRLKNVKATISSLFPETNENHQKKKRNLITQSKTCHEKSPPTYQMIPTEHPAILYKKPLSSKTSKKPPETLSDRNLRLHILKEKLLFSQSIARKHTILSSGY
jgi:coiled-coil domain-containing protein 130